MITAQETLAHPAQAKLTRFMAAAVVAGILMATLPTLMTCGGVTLLEVAGTARQTHGVHLAILGIGTAVALLVCGTLLYSISTFRATGEQASGVRRAIRETIWALVPVAIVIGAALPAVHAFVVADVSGTGQAVPSASHRCAISPGNQS
jgi:heme/copper-type cytochrome/quinol oxidase subunit 2